MQKCIQKSKDVKEDLERGFTQLSFNEYSIYTEEAFVEYPLYIMVPLNILTG